MKCVTMQRIGRTLLAAALLSAAVSPAAAWAIPPQGQATITGEIIEIRKFLGDQGAPTNVRVYVREEADSGVQQKQKPQQQQQQGKGHVAKIHVPDAVFTQQSQQQQGKVKPTQYDGAQLQVGQRVRVTAHVGGLDDETGEPRLTAQKVQVLPGGLK